MIKRWFCFIFLALTSFATAQEAVWIKQQIREDLLQIPKKRLDAKLLKLAFHELSESHHQLLYCQIRSNQVSWTASPRTDAWRNQHIFKYFQELSKRFQLPDTDFILMTEDGCSAPMSVPIFAFSKHVQATNVCLFPDFEVLWEVIDAERHWLSPCRYYASLHPWETKISGAFFRGAPTGDYDPSRADFGNDRVRAVIFSAQHPDLLDAALSYVSEDPMKELLSSLNKPVSSAPIEEHFRYKYLLDIDGNACTYSRARWILLSNSTLVKVLSPNSQWYYKSLEPWVHYVPVKQDLSDLYDTLHFLKTHDKLAHQIAKNGRLLGKTLFSRDTVDLYIVTLLRTYATKITPAP